MDNDNIHFACIQVKLLRHLYDFATFDLLSWESSPSIYSGAEWRKHAYPTRILCAKIWLIRCGRAHAGHPNMRPSLPPSTYTKSYLLGRFGSQ
jgi:hypothetical protein